MLRTTFFTTGNNSYLYSFNRNQIIYAHPIIERLFRKDILKVNGEVEPDSINSSERDSIYETMDLKYYIGKYNFLNQNGFFDLFKSSRIVGRLLNASDIEYELANLRALVFEVTERCNLQCKYCFYGDNYRSYDSRNNRDLSTKDAKALIKYLMPRWKSNLNTNPEKEINIGFFGGEPLLNFSFIEEIVQFTLDIERKSKLRFRYNMTTNGVLLDKHIDFITKNNFALTISIDGDERSNSYRLFPNGKTSSKIVNKNIHFIKECLNTLFLGHFFQKGLEHYYCHPD